MMTLTQKDKGRSSARLNTLLQGRIENLVYKVVDEIESDASVGMSLQLDDEQLMHQVFLHYLAGSSRMDKRERLKMQRRIEGSLSFYDMLQRLGGTLRASEVAGLLKVSRQTVNNYAKSGKLLAVKPAKENLFPAFQFDGDGMLAHFEQILASLPSNLSPITKTSFFTSMAFFNDDHRSVLEILQSGEVTSLQLATILHRAKLVDRPVDEDDDHND